MRRAAFSRSLLVGCVVGSIAGCGPAFSPTPLVVGGAEVEAPPPLRLASTTTACPTGTGQRISAGLDVDGDGALGDDEATAAVDVCPGANGVSAPPVTLRVGTAP